MKTPKDSSYIRVLVALPLLSVTSLKPRHLWTHNAINFPLLSSDAIESRGNIAGFDKYSLENHKHYKAKGYIKSIEWEDFC